ncbi:MAG: hypothetical protein ACOC38_13040 [Promethearchaeia archaeon]
MGVTCVLTDFVSEVDEVNIEWSYEGSLAADGMLPFADDSYQFTIGSFSEAGDVNVEIEAKDSEENCATTEFAIEIGEPERAVELPIPLLVARSRGYCVFCSTSSRKEAVVPLPK